MVERRPALTLLAHLTLILGVLIGTYSSIFIATPVLILLGTVMSEKKTATEAKAAAAARP